MKSPTTGLVLALVLVSGVLFGCASQPPGSVPDYTYPSGSAPSDNHPDTRTAYAPLLVGGAGGPGR